MPIPSSDAHIVDVYHHRYHLHPWNEIFSGLKTDANIGLTRQQYADNVSRFGNNKIHLKTSIPWYRRLLAQFTNLFAVLLAVGGVLCFIGYALNVESPDNLYLGIVLIVVVIATALFSFYQESQSSSIMASFQKMIPMNAKVLRDGQLVNLPVDQLTMGDVTELATGDKVPADIRLLSVGGLKVDNSMLTGENEPQDRSPAEAAERILESPNMAFYGTLVVEGSGKGVVVQIGDATEMGKIAALTTDTKSEPTPIRKELSRFVKIITVIAIVLGVVFTMLGLIKTNDWTALSTWRNNLIFGIGIIVANVPEGLLATVTIVLTLAAKRMAKKSVLVKNLEAVETLGSTSVICSDKTGTLTYNRMTVAELWFDGRLHKVELGNDNSATIDTGNDEMAITDLASFERLYFAAKRCNGASFEERESSETAILNKPVIGNMSDAAILKFTQLVEMNNLVRPEWAAIHNTGTGPIALTRVGEIPFNSRNKWHLTVDAAPQEFMFVLKGAPERILHRCSTYLDGGANRPIDDEFHRKFQDGYEQLARTGQRVLGFAVKYQSKSNPEQVFGPDLASIDTETSELLRGYTFVGFIGFFDPPRTEVKYSIEQCHTAGIRVVMVTGDHPLTARSIATEVGIIQTGNPVIVLDASTVGTHHFEMNCEGPNTAVTVHGEILEDLTDLQWDYLMTRNQLVFARTSPEQKLTIVRQCQHRGYIVAVTGDGVNDSPALKSADIGVAMGINGSDVSKEAADMILMDDNFASIVNGIVEGRTVFDNLKKSIAYTLSSNIPEITPFLIFMIVGIPLPLTTVLILLIDLCTDMLPAISLAYEQPEDDIMHRKPRDPKRDRLVTWQLIAFSYLQIGVLQAIAGFFVYFYVMHEYGFPYYVLPGLGTTDWGQRDVYCQVNSEVNLTAALGNSSLVDTRTGRDFNDLVECSFSSHNSTWPRWADAHHSKVALETAQTAFFISIIVVQIADLMICKTRKLSLFQQPVNRVSLIGIATEIAFGALFCYVPYLNIILGTRPIKWYHWFLGVPFAIVIVVYDELRKLWIRTWPKGWVYRLTYW